MKRLLLLLGAVAALATMSRAPANADAYVDSPSFGRIVYGLTGGEVVLPQDAWQGAYPDGTGTSALPQPPDSAFGGGAILSGKNRQYLGDVVNAARGLATPGSDTGITYGTAVTYNGGSATSVALNTTGVFDSGSVKPLDVIAATKLGFVAGYAWESQIGAYGANGGAKPTPADVATMFGTHTGAGATSTVTTTNPFALKFWSNGAGKIPAFDYYSDNPANNSGYSANKLYDHVKAYQVTDVANPYFGMWFVGFEDTNFNTKNAPKGQGGYHRFDYNDSVIELTFEAVPEPAFYQMAGLLSLGAFGLMRMRRRSS